ncbi:MAG: thiol:disulfide interchange protein DsbA/DsbL, partial [Methylococcaceae bacterium]|nr:thiol:disulfide interchange protein DsbA/DsbL [Methylococcaceae bacterium]
MYKKIIASALFTLMLSFTSIINAETLGYEAVTPAQPTKSTDKIEVIEYFWYGCPHCYSFEPFLSTWAKTLPKNVEFIRQPAVFSELWGKHAKAYFTAEALGVVDKVH